MERVDEIKSMIIEYLTEMADVPESELSDGSVKLTDLNIDSLTFFDMLVELEKHSGVNIEDAKLSGMTLDGLAGYIASARATTEV